MIHGSVPRTRARSLVVPRWWLDAAQAAAAQSGMGLVALGEALARTVKRDPPWNHGSISRFIRGERVTDDLVEAFVAHFDLPRPVYYPRDYAEAVIYKTASEISDAAARKSADEKRERRLRDLDEVAEQMAAPAPSQTRTVVSANAGSRGGGRTAGKVRTPPRGD